MTDGTSKGLVQVYTGDGKGKTSAAWGQVLRAVGHGWSIAVVRFLKSRGSGEVEAARCFNERVTVFGHDCRYDPGADQRGSEKLKRIVREDFHTASSVVMSDLYNMVVLDEIGIALGYGFVSEGEVLNLIDHRPDRLHLILTGRHVPRSVIDAADLVSDIADVKHPFSTGGKAVAGIEY